ncbi:putative inorganic diphosphatase [Helianthus annuus]|nr:putative inorganic diphosphatase [Helianthus annuus]
MDRLTTCTVVGIIFSLLQWFLLSKVSLSLDKPEFMESLIEEEEGVNDHTVIQNTVSKGSSSTRYE